jgi:DNA-binding response OmpR family regulator
MWPRGAGEAGRLLPVRIRRVVELKLRKRGYDVLMAMNGEEGLHLIESEQPDAVVTDIMMPKLDGKNLCK